MQRAAAGLATRWSTCSGGVRAPGAAAGRARGTTAATRCTPGRCSPGAGCRSRRGCSADRAHEGGAGRAAAGRRPGRRSSAAQPARRGGRRHRRASAAAPGCAGRAADALQALHGVPVVAVDTPCGVDVDTGEVDGAHVEADADRHLRHPQGRHLVDPAARAAARCTSSTSASTCPTPAVEALQPAGRRGAAAAARRSTRRSTPAAWSASAPAARSTPAPRCSAWPARPAGWAGWCGTSATRRSPTRSARRTPRWSATAGCRPGWSAPAAASGAGDELAAALADGVPVVVDADALQHVATRASAGGAHPARRRAGRDARTSSGTEVEARPLHHARAAAETVRRRGAAQGPPHAGRPARRPGAGHHDRHAVAGHRRRRRRAGRPRRRAAGRRPDAVRRRARSAPGCTAPPRPWPRDGGPLVASERGPGAARGGRAPAMVRSDDEHRPRAPRSWSTSPRSGTTSRLLKELDRHAG